MSSLKRGIHKYRLGYYHCRTIRLPWKNPWEYRRNRLYRKQYKNQNDLYYNKPIYRQETIFQTSIGFDKIKDPETLVLLELYSHWPGHGTTIYLYLVFSIICACSYMLIQNCLIGSVLETIFTNK